jgi:hypothetical protein
MADGVAGVAWEGVAAFKAAMDRLIAAIDMAGREVVAKGGHIIEAHTKQNMSGDWPNVVSGNLRRSVQVRNVVHLGVGRWSSETAPATVYGRRIELGFKGTDSIGRSYNQAPRLPLTKGLEQSKPELIALHKAAMAMALKA